MKLRRVLRHLRPTCTDNDGICLLRTMSTLWDKWLSLLEAAKEWEMWCEELKQEWKFVSEEVSASFSAVQPYSIVLNRLSHAIYPFAIIFY